MSKTESPTALLVDDSRTQLEFLKEILGAVGFQVLTADSPLEALKKLAKESVQILITDFALPNIKSVELARHARTLPGYAELPVLVLTAAGAQELDLSHFLTGPAIRFCSKSEIKEVLPELCSVFRG